MNSGYGEHQETLFIRCSVFGKPAESLCQYVGKGGEVLVDGRMSQSDYTDKNGEKRRTTRLMVESVQFGAKTQQGVAQAQQYGQTKYQQVGVYAAPQMAQYAPQYGYQQPNSRADRQRHLLGFDSPLAKRIEKALRKANG